MAKSSPEKLAAALRANLKRRKQASGGSLDKGHAPEPAPRPSRPIGLAKPPKNSA